MEGRIYEVCLYGLAGNIRYGLCYRVLCRNLYESSEMPI
jgi:hypothetical protein